jgi:hypothetical protein
MIGQISPILSHIVGLKPTLLYPNHFVALPSFAGGCACRREKMKNHAGIMQHDSAFPAMICGSIAENYVE